jgi:hypothetical protein
MGRNFHWSLIVSSKDGSRSFPKVDPRRVANSGRSHEYVPRGGRSVTAEPITKSPCDRP